MRILFMYLLLLIPNTVFSQVDTSVRKSITKFLIDEKEISNKKNTGKMLYTQTNLSLLASLDTCNKIYLFSFSSTSFHSKKYHLISSPNLKRYIYNNDVFEAIKTVDSYIDTMCSNITDNNKIEIIESLIFANRTRSKKNYQK